MVLKMLQVKKKEKKAAVNSCGGSYLIHQRWEHNLKYFNQLDLNTQQHTFGRKKDWSAELSKEVMKPTAHVARMRDKNFEKIPIVRQSMPFGNVGNKRGLLFIGYSKNTKKMDTMLDRMTSNDDEHSDEVMKFSKNVTGNYYYFPPVEQLTSLKK